MKASSLSFQVAILCAVAGMIWGLQMGLSGDHAAYPAHAHLNLLGWVSLFLFGIYYRMRPTLEHDRRALTQVWLWLAGTIVQAIGVGLGARRRQSLLPRAAQSSFSSRCFCLRGSYSNPSVLIRQLCCIDSCGWLNPESPGVRVQPSRGATPGISGRGKPRTDGNQSAFMCNRIRDV